MDTALIGDGQGAHLRDGELFAGIGAVGEHRCIVCGTNRTTHKWQHTVVVSAYIRRAEEILFGTEDTFTAECVRIRAALAGRLIRTMDIDEHMVFRGDPHQTIIELDIILGL